ncbi:hypothetical protein N9D72_02960 [Porticoccaceae bacterium]|nr:hypothetical protein [Porticoccaceae bacterium]
MKTVTVNFGLSSPLKLKRQAGVALLQVLLLSTTVTVLALGFTKTAREQIRMAEAIEGRILAQFEADSVMNEVVFSQLAHQVYPQAAFGDSDIGPVVERKEDLNLFNKPVMWTSDAIIRIQDLNGLLPQAYPQHFAWSKLLFQLGLTEAEIEAYLGVWGDAQDPDRRSWIIGAEEPSALPNGMPYINGTAQSDQVMRAVFADRPDIIEQLLAYSNIYSPYKINLLNTPKPLLITLLGDELGTSVSNMRESGANEVTIRSMLPSEFRVESVSIYRSTYHRIDISVEFGDFKWNQSRIIRVSPSSETPFSVLFNS